MTNSPQAGGLDVGARKNGNMNIYSLADEKIEKTKTALVEQNPLVPKHSVANFCGCPDKVAA